MANSAKKAVFLEYNPLNKVFGDIYCFDFQTSKKMKIIESNFDLSHLAWSPDGTRLYFGNKPFSNISTNADSMYDDEGISRILEFDFTTGCIGMKAIQNNSNRNKYIEDYLFGYFSINWTNKGLYYYCNPHFISFADNDKDTAETLTEFENDSFVSGLSVSNDNKSLAFLISKMLGKRVPYAIGVLDLQTKSVTYLDRQIAGNVFDWKSDNQTILVEDASELYESNVPQNRAVKPNLPGIPGEFTLKECSYLSDNEIICRYIPVTKDQNMYRSEIRIFNIKNGRSRQVASGLNQRKCLALYKK